LEEQVLRKRPNLRRECVEAAFADPLTRESQPDGRICFCYRVDLETEGKPYILGVVTLEGGETVHNAFL
jgi:hypothetical protein